MTVQPNDLDKVDRAILRLLQENARISNAEIARRVSMAPSAVLERLRKLEDRKVIEGYAPRLNAQQLGHGLLAFVFVRTDGAAWESAAAEKLARFPEVQEIHHIAGEDCLIAKVRVADTEALGQLLREKFSTIKAVRSTRTTIALGTIKETTALPL